VLHRNSTCMEAKIFDWLSYITRTRQETGVVSAFGLQNSGVLPAQTPASSKTACQTNLLAGLQVPSDSSTAGIAIPRAEPAGEAAAAAAVLAATAAAAPGADVPLESGLQGFRHTNLAQHIMTWQSLVPCLRATGMRIQRKPLP
jgi:hypothetical protein